MAGWQRQTFDTAGPNLILGAWAPSTYRSAIAAMTSKSAPACLARLGAECARLGLGTRCAIISDTNVAPRYGKAAQKSLAQAGFAPTLITIPAGETAKSLRTVAACYDQLAAQRLERKSFIVALGGGVVGDLAGFVAATYLRGLAFVQVPTTLLGAGGQLCRRQSWLEPEGGQEPRRRLLPAAPGAVRPGHARLVAHARVPGRPRGSDQIRHHLRRRPLPSAWSATCPSCCAATTAPWRRSSPAVARSRPMSSGRTRRRAACAPS